MSTDQDGIDSLRCYPKMRPKGLLTDANEQEAEIRRLMIERAKALRLNRGPHEIRPRLVFPYCSNLAFRVRYLR
jgi:hypothetical protein